MGLDLILFAVVVLIGFAFFDLIVGVSNDAVNFLNSSLGSKVAPRYVILTIASVGIMAGVSFSSGMMEVARKGIFHPQFFTMPELITIFLAVMLTDIVLLDLFNTYGLPTSTTVSIVFELLGGTVAVSIMKILQSDSDLLTLSQYINTGKAMMIIFGILISVVVAFLCGAFAQFLSRLLFTFDYVKRLKRYGAIWGGIALGMITYFILVKGAKGSTFMAPETVDWIADHTILILLFIFTFSAVLLQILLFFKVNILKPIVLVGTFALAMAFAANDLVNFIGVPMAGFHAYSIALTTDTPLTSNMGALGQKVASSPWMIMLAGLVMVITMWFSKKARTVSETELTLGRQAEDEERYDSTFLSRAIVRMVDGLLDYVRMVTPSFMTRWVNNRLDTTQYKANTDADQRPSFDLLRASVNMMVASAVISYATSQKLPLSTTYVTFMVSMGSSFADLAWGRESAVYRITGVLTVVGGWFMTAMLAFSISGLVAVAVFYGKTYGMGAVLILIGLIIWKNHSKHSERTKQKEMDQVFNLKKVTDASDTISMTFEHMGQFLHEIRTSLDAAFIALFNQNEYLLNAERKKIKTIQHWANIIIANVFKSMRLLLKEDPVMSQKYGQTIRRLQKLADGHRDMILRSHVHVSNHHKGLLDVQIVELQKVRGLIYDILYEVESAFRKKNTVKYKTVVEYDQKLRDLAESLNQVQMERIRTEESKTRLSILFYALVGNAMMMSKQNLKLTEIFSEAFEGVEKSTSFDMD